MFWTISSHHHHMPPELSTYDCERKLCYNYDTKHICFFFFNFFFEIIVNSQAVVKNNTGRFWVPLMQFPSIITSFKIIEQYYNQNIYVNKIQWFFLDFSSFTCIHLYLCVSWSINTIEFRSMQFYHLHEYVY